MLTIVYLVVGGFILLVVLGIIISLVQGIASGAGGILFFVWSIIRHFPILTVLFIGTTIASGNPVMSSLLYTFLIVIMTRREAAADIREQVVKLLEEYGAIPRERVEAMIPSPTSPIHHLMKSLYNKAGGVKYLQKRVRKNELITQRVGGVEYFCYAARWEELQREIQSKTMATMAGALQTTGVLTDEMIGQVANNWWEDLKPFAKAVIAKTFSESMDRYVMENRVLAREVKDGLKTVQLYIDREMLAKHERQIHGAEIIDSVELNKLFGERSVAEQDAIMHIIASVWSDMEYKLVSKVNDTFWIRPEAIPTHTCDNCNGASKKLEQYGKKRVCGTCMHQIEKKNKEDEDAGKPVRRPIAGPPPELKLKNGK